ncbi:MAG: hypothetical protein J6A61_05025 [Clostridia bacterium]|nr:hypothetical protein [Clostridia bacterium]
MSSNKQDLDLLCLYLHSKLLDMRYHISKKENLEFTSYAINQLQEYFNNKKYTFTYFECKEELKKSYIKKRFMRKSHINEILLIMMVSLSILEKLLRNELFDMAYQLVDMIHFLPELIFTNRKLNNKDFLSAYVIPFSKL